MKNRRDGRKDEWGKLKRDGVNWWLVGGVMFVVLMIVGTISESGDNEIPRPTPVVSPPKILKVAQVRPSVQTPVSSYERDNSYKPVGGRATPWPKNTPVANIGRTTAVKEGTLTADESLREFVFCDRLKAHMFQTWGQTSQVIYSGDPRVTGEIEPGDYVRVLTPKPNSDGAIRLQVYPHDNRAVGKTGDKVWINWGFLAQFGTERAMFKCED